MSARSAPRILSIKCNRECTFLFLNFLITGLSNSSAYCLFEIEARPFWFPSYFEFLSLLNASSRNILSEAVLLVKS